MTNIPVTVMITQNPNQTYSWSYSSNYPGFNQKTGEIKFISPGETTITYTLQGDAYSLIYVNLDPYICATREIRAVSIDPQNNAISITDANGGGQTGSTPFSIQLIARVAGDLGAPIVSPDPQVENDPPPHAGP